ncbi:MAG: tetratricopeptide (TPR) repeat protein [Flavobacteriales bacterium]|jgi:tetratricopeptide (TPR) repeat protein
MSTPTQDAFDQFEERSATLASYRAVVQTVAGPADLDFYVRATETYCSVESRDDAWRIWLGAAERARQLGRPELETESREHAVAAAPERAHVLEFLSHALPAGRARAQALQRCGDFEGRTLKQRAASLTEAAREFVAAGEEEDAVEIWESLADLDAAHILIAARELTTLAEQMGSPAGVVARAGALLLRAQGDVALDLWKLSQSTAGLVDDAIVLDWVVRVVADAPDLMQAVLHWSRGVRGASPAHPEWRALHRTWSEAVGDTETQHQALTEEAATTNGADRAAILLRRAALEREPMKAPKRAFKTVSEALDADGGAAALGILASLVDHAECAHSAATLLCTLADHRGEPGAALVGQRVLSSLDDSNDAQLALARCLAASGIAPEQLSVLSRVVRRSPSDSDSVGALLRAVEAHDAWEDAADALCASSASDWPPDLRSACLDALARARRWPDFFRNALTLGLVQDVPAESLLKERVAALALLGTIEDRGAERALWLSRLASVFGAGDAELWPHILDLAPSQVSLREAVPDAVAAAREAGDEARIERVLSLQDGADALQLESDLLGLARQRGDTATADRWAREILSEDSSHALASTYASTRWELAPDVAERLLLIGIDALADDVRAARYVELAIGSNTSGAALNHWIAAASIESQPPNARIGAWCAALKQASAAVDVAALCTLASQRGLPVEAARSLDETLDELCARGEGELVEQLIDFAGEAFADAQFQDRRAVCAYRAGRWQDAADAWSTVTLRDDTDRSALAMVARLRAGGDNTLTALADEALACLLSTPAAPDLVEAIRESERHAALAERYVAECEQVHAGSADHWEAAAALAEWTPHQQRAWLGWVAAAPGALYPLRLLEERGDDEAKRTALNLRLANADDAGQVAVRLALVELEPDESRRESLLLEVLEFDLGDVQARRALATLYEKAERIEDAATLWDEIASFTDSQAERVAALHHTARLLIGGDSRQRALNALEQVLNLDPEDAKARETLENAYTTAGDNAGLAALWGRIAAAVTDVEERLAWLKRAATLHESSEHPELAMPYLVRALGIEPANLSLLERVAAVQSGLGEWDELLSTLERIAEATPMAEVRNEILVRAFRVLHTHLDRQGHALDLIRAACAHLVPTDQDLDMMTAAAEASGDWAVWADAMGDVLRARPRSVRRTDDLRTLVSMLDERLNRREDALLWLAEDIADHPLLDERLDEAEAFADALGSRKPLVPAYKALAETTQPALTRWRAYLGSAGVAREAGGVDIAFGIIEQGLALGSPYRDEAIEQLRGMGDNPSCRTEWQRVLTRLAREHSSPSPLYMERALLEHEHLGDWRESMESCLYALRYDAFAPDATALVEKIAQDNDAWAVLAQALTKLRNAAGLDQHAEYDRWLARINGEHLGDITAAYSLHEQAWRQDIASDEARRSFVREAEALGFGEEAMQLVVNETPDEPDAAQQWCDWLVPKALDQNRVEIALNQLRQTAARLADGVDNWVPGTQRYWHERDPADGAYVWFIERSGEASGEAAGVAVLQAAARFAPTDTLRADALNAIVEIAPEDAATQEALWLALDAAGRHDELSEALRVAAIAEPDDELAALLATRSVHHVRRTNHDVGHQAAVMASLVARLPQHADLRDDFELALREGEAWPALVESLAERGLSSESAEAAEPYWLRGADLLDGVVDDATAAAALLARANEANQDTSELVRRRAALYEACGNWGEVVKDCERLADMLEGLPAAHAMGRAASLAETRLDAAPKAAELWLKAVVFAAKWKRPHVRLALLSESAGNDDDASRYLDQAEELSGAYEATELDDVACALLRRAARDEANAERWLRRALELTPANSSAVRRLVDHLISHERFDDASEALERAAADAAPNIALAMHLERACLFMHDLGDPVRAAKAAGVARASAPESRAPFAIEGDVHFAAERFQDAAEAYHAALGFEESLPDDTPSAQVFVRGETMTTPLALYLTRYALALEASGRSREAHDALQSATLEDESHPLALAALARIAYGRDEREAHQRYLRELEAATERGQSAVAGLLEDVPRFD